MTRHTRLHPAVAPPQVKLEWVAMAVGKVGFAVAVACFVVLLIK